MQDFQDRLFDLVPIPSHAPDLQHHRHDPDENIDLRIEVPHPTAGQVIRMDETVHQRWRREFSGTDEEGDVSMEDVVIGEGSSAAVNRFAPFASELDWRVACWAIQDGIGHKSFDRLMAIPGVAEKLGLSYQNIHGLHKIVDAVPPRATWKKRELWFKNDPEDKHIVHHRDPLEAIKTLLGNPAHAEHVVYRPKKIFSDASKSERIYNEMWTGDWWNTIQDRLPSGACVAPVIIATDKTQLTQFTGGKTAYPVYLTLGNLPRAIRRKPSQQACILIAYLSVSKMVGKQLTKKQNLMTTAELDHRIRSLPPCFGVRHFKNGWSQLSQVSGKERKDMARILLGCIMGKAPSQYPTHDDSTLQYLTNALDEFHANKDILVDLGIRNHFNIPKFHSMLHYEECIRNFGTTDNYNTEMFERFHIDYAKEAWRASNFRNELPQMTQWLSRQEKIVMFQSYISHYQSEEEREEEHGCPSFSYHLRIFLNKFLTRGDSIPRTQVGNAFLPFDKLDVWHSFKFSLDTLGNDVDGQKGIDLVRAQPGRGKSPGRFDVVVVTHNDGAESTGLHGMKVGRLRLIFRLPEVIGLYNEAPSVWPKHHFAYVEWLTFKYAYQTLW
ncbi:hypothetical protein F4604DRAFT_1884476 [Suillus subluteus]|nr:hypothetical protein F4604DRAFT_1884476 [Suillus subluteus]